MSSFSVPQVLSLLPEYVRRMFKVKQMDIEETMWQMLNLCLNPKKVYERTRYHKQTKNQWARDDPAFVAITIYCLIITSSAYAIAFNERGFMQIVHLIFWSIIVDFLIFGVLTATVGWYLSNKFLIHQEPGLHSVEQSVEWLYAFDVHCNSFFPLFILLYVIQYLLIPILYSTSWFMAFLSDTLYLIAACYYYYITFLGYTILPFLHNTQVLLYPIGVVVILYLIALLFGFNATLFVINFYFQS
uniref:UNC-50 family protein n=1 Tax=Arcella intermedia TaxID=1963864 RepID=A0A6B2LFX4_9EUKA